MILLFNIVIGIAFIGLIVYSALVFSSRQEQMMQHLEEDIHAFDFEPFEVLVGVDELNELGEFIRQERIARCLEENTYAFDFESFEALVDADELNELGEFIQ